MPSWDVYFTLPWSNTNSDISWSSSSGVGIEIQHSGTVTNAQDGSHYVELDSHGASDTNMSMVQSITLPAGDFTLSFWYKPRTSDTNDNQVNVYWDNQLLITIDETAELPWTQYTFGIPDEPAETHTLVFEGAGTDNSLGGFIDNVVLTCGLPDESEPTLGTVTLSKTVINDNEGSSEVDDFSFFIDGNEVSLNTPIPLSEGTYTITESGPEGYTASFSGDCTSSGFISVSNDQILTCTITNDDNEPSGGGGGSQQDTNPTITINKNVINDDGGEAIADDFSFLLTSTTEESLTTPRVTVLLSQYFQVTTL